MKPRQVRGRPSIKNTPNFKNSLHSYCHVSFNFSGVLHENLSPIRSVNTRPPFPLSLDFLLVPSHRDAEDVSKGGGRSFSHIRILERIGVGHQLHQQPPGAVANHLRRVNLYCRWT